VEEETGIDVKVGNVMGVVESIYKGDSAEAVFHYIIVDLVGIPADPERTVPQAMDDAEGMPNGFEYGMHFESFLYKTCPYIKLAVCLFVATHAGQMPGGWTSRALTLTGLLRPGWPSFWPRAWQ
jgi:hypothetical protein